jgi:hypothetical protein
MLSRRPERKFNEVAQVICETGCVRFSDVTDHLAVQCMHEMKSGL